MLIPLIGAIGIALYRHKKATLPAALWSGAGILVISISLIITPDDTHAVRLLAEAAVIVELIFYVLGVWLIFRKIGPLGGATALEAINHYFVPPGYHGWFLAGSVINSVSGYLARLFASEAASPDATAVTLQLSDW